MADESFYTRNKARIDELDRKVITATDEILKLKKQLKEATEEALKQEKQLKGAAAEALRQQGENLRLKKQELRELQRELSTRARLSVQHDETLSKLSASMRESERLNSIISKSLRTYNSGLSGSIASLLSGIKVYSAAVNKEKLRIKTLDSQIIAQEKYIARLKDADKATAEAYLETLKLQRSEAQTSLKLTKVSAVLDIVNDVSSKLAETIRNTSKQLGVAPGQALGLEFSNLAASFESFTASLFSGFSKVGVTSQQILQTQADFQEEFGGVLTSDAARALAEEATRLGVTTAQMAKARRAFMTVTLGDVAKAKAETDKFIATFVKQGLTAKDAMNAIVQNSNLLARNGSRFADSFARALADSKKMGVELGKVDQFADSIIGNFEGFLETSAELAALGIDLDTNRLTEIAYTGDAPAFQAELQSQLKALGPRLLNMDRATQLTLSQLSGLSMEEMQRMAGLIAGSGEETISIEQQNNSLLSRIANASFVLNGIVSAIGITVAYIAKLQTLQLGMGAGKALGSLGSIAAGVGGVGFGLGGMAYAYQGGKEKDLSTSIVGILSSTAGFAATGLAVGGPKGAVIGALIGLLLGAGSAVMGHGDDVISRPGYGKRKLLTEKGIISLNNRDNIIAYADDVVSDGSGITRFPKGALASSIATLPDLNVIANPGLASSIATLPNLNVTAPPPISTNVTVPDDSILPVAKDSVSYAKKVSDFLISFFPKEAIIDLVKSPPRVPFSSKIFRTKGILERDWGKAFAQFTPMYRKAIAQSLFAFIPRKARELVTPRQPTITRAGLLTAGPFSSAAPPPPPPLKPSRRILQSLPASGTGPNITELRRVVNDAIPENSGTYLKDFTESMKTGSGRFAATGKLLNVGLRRTSSLLTLGDITAKAYKKDYLGVAESLTKLLVGKAAQAAVTIGVTALSGGAATPLGVGLGIGADVLASYLVGKIFDVARGNIETYQNERFEREASGNSSIANALMAGVTNPTYPQSSEYGGFGSDYEKYHNGGIVGMNGSKQEVPAILQKGEAVLTQPQFQRVQEIADLLTIAGVNTAPTPTTPSPQVSVDFSRLEARMEQMVRAISGMQVNLDGTRVGNVLVDNSTAAMAYGILRR